MKNRQDKDHTVLRAAGFVPAGLVILLLSLLVRACGKEWKLPADTTCSAVLSEYSSSASTFPASSAVIVFSETTVSTVSTTVSERASSTVTSAPAAVFPTIAAPITAAPSTAAPATTSPTAVPTTTAALTTAAPTTVTPTTSAALTAAAQTTAAPTAVTPTTSAPTVHTHLFTPWTVTSPPSCTVSGTEARTCSGCGLSETRPVPAPGHDWHTETVVVREAWIEYVKIRDAWDEVLILQEPRTEEITEMHWFCEGCGMDQTVYAREHGLLDADGRWTDEGLAWDAQHAKEHALRGESDRTYSAPVVIGIIEYPAETAVLHHEEEYAPVVHPEKTAEIRKCARCGAEE
nr:hypothetical protein [Lachnospiraceae bacterium]